GDEHDRVLVVELRAEEPSVPILDVRARREEPLAVEGVVRPDEERAEAAEIVYVGAGRATDDDGGVAGHGGETTPRARRRQGAPARRTRAAQRTRAARRTRAVARPRGARAPRHVRRQRGARCAAATPRRR